MTIRNKLTGHHSDEYDQFDLESSPSRLGNAAPVVTTADKFDQTHNGAINITHEFQVQRDSTES